MKKLPPREKIHEAFSAVADGRVEMRENDAVVRSSDGAREYSVRWSGDEYSSNDSATYWQLYPGYPVIAVLMLQGKLPFDRDVAASFAGVNWTELNAKHKRNYAKAAAEVMERIRSGGGDLGRIEDEISAVWRGLENLDVAIRRGSLRPPK